MTTSPTLPSFAATTTGTLTISATVLSTCSVVGSSIAFGNYTGIQVDQTGTLSVLCTNGTSYNL